MQSMPNPKPSDDPHDFVVVAPDVVRVAPADEELSNLLQEAARRSSKLQAQKESDFPAAPPVPAVDTTFRPVATDNLQVLGHRRSMGRAAIRGLTALLLTACIGGAAIAWQSSGTVAKQIIAKWAPKLILTSLLSPETQAPAAQPAAPAVQADAATAASPQPAAPQPVPPAQAASEGVAPPAAAPSPDSTQMLQSMARDLAAARQEIEQLKANQEQMSRDIARVSDARVSEAKASDAKVSDARTSNAKTSEHNPRPRISALPPRPAAAPARRPMPPPLPPPQAAGVPALPQAAAPYVPRQPEPLPQSMGTQATGQPLTDPELASVPRPPMPVR
jgi:hypothetical protein